MSKQHNTSSDESSGSTLPKSQRILPRNSYSEGLKISKTESIKMSKFNKISKSDQPPSIVTPGYRETGDLMTIDDEVKTIAEGSDANESEVLNPEQLCDQTLEVPDDTTSENYEDNLLIVPPPSASLSNPHSIDKLPLLPGFDGAGPTSPFIVELFRRGIDINDAEERTKLNERLKNTNNVAERSSIEAYIRVSMTMSFCIYIS
jgi:hypothetical protein